jgi:hypothetical protein
MPHSGFKTAQRCINIRKKRNHNKDYRVRRFIKPSRMRFASGWLDLNYVLRTEYGIRLNQKQIRQIYYYLGGGFGHKQFVNPFYLNNVSDELNQFLNEFARTFYYTNKYQQIQSRDHTHTAHSKKFARMRKKDRDWKWIDWTDQQDGMSLEFHEWPFRDEEVWSDWDDYGI